MSVSYIGKMIAPPGGPVDKLPPSVLTCSWFLNIVNILETQGEINRETFDGYIRMTFDNQTDLENWVNANALTDPTLLNDIKEFNRTCNIVHYNEIHHDDGSITSINIGLIPPSLIV